jgi:hypothetical protein
MTEQNPVLSRPIYDGAHHSPAPTMPSMACAHRTQYPAYGGSMTHSVRSVLCAAWGETPVLRLTIQRIRHQGKCLVLKVIFMLVDAQLTLLSAVLLLAAVVGPMVLNYRRRTRLAGPRTSPTAQSRTADTAVFAVCASLTAAGGALLVLAGLL